MLTNSQLEILATELAQPDYAELVEAQNYPALAALLNAQPLIANPTPQTLTPKRLTLHEVFAAIHSADDAAVSALAQAYGPILDRIDAALQANDRVATMDYFAIVGSGMNETAQGAVVAFLNSTELDPTWPAQIAGNSRATALGLPAITEHDVQLCLHPELWRMA